jgi:hypothetical protein
LLPCRLGQDWIPSLITSISHFIGWRNHLLISAEKRTRHRLKICQGFQKETFRDKPFSFEQMAMVGSVGAGTFAFILLFCILIVLLILVIATNMSLMRIAFWAYLVVVILLLIIMSNVPYERTEPTPETNQHLKIHASFGAFIFLGLVLAIVFYLLVVLLHQDLATVLVNSS